MTTEGLNHLKWAAWGVVDIEALDRQQRRNYLKKVHAELKPQGFQMHVGGTTQKPYYLVTKSDDAIKKMHGHNSEHAFADACKQILLLLGETANVSGEDGGVRRAGDEAEGEPAASVG